MTTTSRTRALLLLTAAFAVGAVVGGVGMNMKDGNGRSRSNRDDCVVKHRQACYWAEELTLTSDQQDSLVAVYRIGEKLVDSVHKSIRPAVDSIYQSVRPQVDSQRVRIREQVRPLLTTMQRERYDSIVNAWDESRGRNRERQSAASEGQSRDKR